MYAFLKWLVTQKFNFCVGFHTSVKDFFGICGLFYVLLNARVPGYLDLNFHNMSPFELKIRKMYRKYAKRGQIVRETLQKSKIFGWPVTLSTSHILKGKHIFVWEIFRPRELKKYFFVKTFLRRSFKIYNFSPKNWAYPIQRVHPFSDSLSFILYFKIN